MSANAQYVQDMLTELNEEDYLAAASFIGYLRDKRKKERIKQGQKTLAEIQAMFADDKGWASEEEMLKDMADFRRERLGL